LRSLTLTYTKSGLTAKARLEGRVQGVVVQAKNLTLGSLTSGKVTWMDGSSTSL